MFNSAAFSKFPVSYKLTSFALAASIFVSGCDSDSTSTIVENTPFTLNFTAQSAGETVSCGDTLNNFGATDSHQISISDLRFYVSNIQFYDENDNEINVEFNENDFQRNSTEGFVGLVDLTSNTTGACTDAALGGTERTNPGISGTVISTTLTDNTIARVSFDVGVPQAVMKDVIATNTQEDAPTPLNEMYWSWASGYRHFVMNFTIENSAEEAGKGALHLGSRNCSGVDDAKALESKDSCDLVNTPKVSLTNLDLANDTIVVDLDEMLKNVTFEATGDETVPTVSCHSSPMQTDCAEVFENFGLDLNSGSADADNNHVFIKE